MGKMPKQQAKEQFGSKDKLVEEIMGLIGKPANLTKDQLKKKLRSQSNSKLLVLVKRERLLKERFGNRDKLIDTLVKSRSGKKKSEDKDYRKRLTGMTTGQLLDAAKRLKIKSA